MEEGIGDKFQRETKYDRSSLKGTPPDFSKQPGIYKVYPENERFPLPTIESYDLPKKMSLDKALKKRRSIRQFSEMPLSLGHLSYLLWASTGIQRIEYNYEFRTAPSAGALYPIETYVIVNRVAHVKNGVYHYAIKGHQLELLKLGDFGQKTAKAALGQKLCMDSPVIFIWTAIFERSKWKYKQRGYRYIYILMSGTLPRT